MTEPTMATDGSHLQQVALERRHALVVDDTSVMRKAIQRILAQDFIVIEAKHGDGVWEIITSQHPIQMVFVDLMIPNRNGFQLPRDIRESAHPCINRLPVILMTGHEDDEAMRR